MNNHSNRFWRAAIVGVAVLAGACGGGDDGGGAANKAEWEEEYGSAVKVVSDDIDRAVQALNAGQRPVVLSECTQLQEDLADARESLPVPDPTVNAALRDAIDATGTAAGTCVEGARIASDADKIEEAQAQMTAAREKYTAAQDAIAAWS
jgi:hypothetical protein